MCPIIAYLWVPATIVPTSLTPTSVNPEPSSCTSISTWRAASGLSMLTMIWPNLSTYVGDRSLLTSRLATYGYFRTEQMTSLRGVQMPDQYMWYIPLHRILYLCLRLKHMQNRKTILSRTEGPHMRSLNTVGCCYVCRPFVKEYSIYILFDSHLIQQVSWHDYTETNLFVVILALCKCLLCFSVCFDRWGTRHSLF